MSELKEAETGEKVMLVPLEFIKPSPFNITFISHERESMLREEMQRAGLTKIDPILLRRLSPEEMERIRDEFPQVRYEIIDGHTRFRIACDLKWSGIRAITIDADAEKARETGYRKNKERGEVNELMEALYFKHLREDLGLMPYEIAAMFTMKEADVEKILNRAVVSRDARKVLLTESYRLGRPLSEKLLEVIASAPTDKQQVLAEAVIEGRLKPSEAEVARDVIVQGKTKEEAIELAKAAKPAPPRYMQLLEEEKPVALPPTFQPLLEEERRAAPPGAPAPAEGFELTCPRCGAKARINWVERKVAWEQA